MKNNHWPQEKEKETDKLKQKVFVGNLFIKLSLKFRPHNVKGDTKWSMR